MPQCMGDTGAPGHKDCTCPGARGEHTPRCTGGLIPCPVSPSSTCSTTRHHPAPRRMHGTGGPGSSRTRQQAKYRAKCRAKAGQPHGRQPWSGMSLTGPSGQRRGARGTGSVGRGVRWGSGRSCGHGPELRVQAGTAGIGRSCGCRVRAGIVGTGGHCEHRVQAGTQCRQIQAGTLGTGRCRQELRVQAGALQKGRCRQTL